MNPLSLTSLIPLMHEPIDDSSFQQWLSQEDVVLFLQKDGDDENIIVYAGLPHVFIHAILIPRFDVTTEEIDKLREWNFGVSRGWSLVSSGDTTRIEHPLALKGIPLIESGEQIVFLRSFEGVRQKSSYVELNQKIAQVLGLHQLEDRDAWCNLDEHGDIDEIVKNYSLKHLDIDGGTVVTMRRSELVNYATAGGYVILRMFDFARFRIGAFSGHGEQRTIRPIGVSETIFGDLTLCGTAESFSRGVQLLDFDPQQSSILSDNYERDRGTKQYATFIANDFRHQRVAELSCDPEQLSNYFTASPHPFEMSPAFFRPEVLSKYKADPEKYTIAHGSISCRGAWYLQRFASNDAGQVHSYLYYLGNLPYKEQLHWQQFNEPPKAGLSSSVIATDFKGEFSQEYDPLPEIKEKLRAINRRRVGWWQLQDDSLPNRVHYPNTDSRNEWASEIMNFDQLLVEGLNEKWLRKKAEELGRNPDSQWRSLKLLEECLCGLGFEEDHAREIMSPWREVHNLRSKAKGHASSDEGQKNESAARKQHGSLSNHFRHLCQSCEESLQIIVSAIEPKV